MGGGLPKQFRDWGGRPLLRATVEAFFGEGMPVLASIALAVPPEFVEAVESWAFPVPHRVVEGGASRQDSVSAALSVLPGEPGSVVLIHDAVRPFPPARCLHEAIAALESCDGALLAEASTDTLKETNGLGLVLGTLPRERVFRAQTPQVARLGTWRRAFAQAAQDGFQGTDDVSLLEHLGLRVLLVESPSSNLKLTTAEDWRRWSPL